MKIKRRILRAIVKILGKNPPKTVPSSLLKQYTMNGKVEVKEWYLNEVNPFFAPRIYTERRIKKQLALGGYEEVDNLFWEAVKKYPLKDKSVVIMGSTTPFYESVAISCGCRDVTTIEYNKIISTHPFLKTLTPNKFKEKPRQFDIGISISSFEHDGLGRYGDPIDPDGDLRAMEMMKNIIKPGGLLFLAVPIGVDTIFWNAHRVYGKIRLPVLLKKWKILDVIGFKKEYLNIKPEKNIQSIQPIFVLQNI